MRRSHIAQLQGKSARAWALPSRLPLKERQRLYTCRTSKPSDSRDPCRQSDRPRGRRQIAERFLSEDNGEAAKIRGNRVRDLNKIQSEAYRQVEEIRGAADAKATEIYAKAYNQSPKSVAFYEFTRTMQSYKSIIAENTTLVLSTDSDLFKFLKGMTPNGDAVPAPRSGGNR